MSSHARVVEERHGHARSLETLIEGFDTPHELRLLFADVPVRVRTNDGDIWRALASYYRLWVVTEGPPALVEVRLVQGAVSVPGPFSDLVRPGGRKVKEAVREVDGGRLILKRATGVTMAVWRGGAFAAGDLRANLNQGINLVNNCYAKVVLGRGHVLLHASAVSRAGRAVALAGPPGAGKSTAALHLVEAGFRCVSNDRVLAKPGPEGVEALGYPKQPRVNPGTLLHHPRLSVLLPPEDRVALASLTPGELWDLERKADVDIEAIYGPGAVELRGRMEALVLLKWRRDGEGLRVRRLSPGESLADLEYFYKNLGAFDVDRPPQTAITEAERGRYVALLEGVAVVEVTGRVEFKALVGLVDHLLG
jgi:HprK-related kinase B